MDKPGLEQKHNGRWLDPCRWKSWTGKGGVYQSTGANDDHGDIDGNYSGENNDIDNF